MIVFLCAVFYKDEDKSKNVQISELTETNTRALVNSFMSLNEAIPEMKTKTTASIKKVTTAISVIDQTVQNIQNSKLIL